MTAKTAKIISLLLFIASCSPNQDPLEGFWVSAHTLGIMAEFTDTSAVLTGIDNRERIFTYNAVDNDSETFILRDDAVDTQHSLKLSADSRSFIFDDELEFKRPPNIKRRDLLGAWSQEDFHDNDEDIVFVTVFKGSTYDTGMLQLYHNDNEYELEVERDYGHKLLNGFISVTLAEDGNPLYEIYYTSFTEDEAQFLIGESHYRDRKIGDENFVIEKYMEEIIPEGYSPR